MYHKILLNIYLFFEEMSMIIIQLKLQFFSQKGLQVSYHLSELIQPLVMLNECWRVFKGCWELKLYRKGWKHSRSCVCRVGSHLRRIVGEGAWGIMYS